MFVEVIILVALSTIFLINRAGSSRKTKYTGKHRNVDKSYKYTVEAYLNREGMSYA